MEGNSLVGAFGSAPIREKKNITLPSGRTVTVLEITGREEQLLRFGSEAVVATINKFLAAVTEDLDGGTGKVDIKKLEQMLTDDRSFILLQTRILSHGPIVNLTQTCTCKGGTKSQHEINLNDIVSSMRPYPNGDKREFSVKLGAGELYFELPNGEIDAKLSELSREEININSKLTLLRLWEKTPKGNLPVTLNNLKSKDIAQLRAALNEKEAFLDTYTTLTCPSCKAEYRRDVVATLDFLFPNSK